SQASPQLAAWLRAGRVRLAWNGRGDFVFFKRYTDQSTAGAAQSARVDLPFNRLRFFATDSYLTARERPSLDVDIRIRRVERAIGAGIDIRLTTFTSIALTAQSGATSFEQSASADGGAVAAALDRHAQQFGASFVHQLTPLTALNASFTTETNSFDANRLRDSRRNTLRVGFGFKPLALITGQVDAAVLDFTPSDSR